MVKVSVCVITYNHEKFIAQTLDSLLMQQTTFPFEIVVGDDMSKDNTRAILQDYQRRYPDKIRLLLHTKNLGLNGKFNALSTFAVAKGEYIAQIDGDDYLTSPHKLQKQVDMLDANPHYSASFHNAKVVYEDGTAPSYLMYDGSKSEITEKDLIGEDELLFIATSSLMFRRADFEKNPDPEWTNQSTSGDIPRNILFASRGPIGYIDEVMSVYRKNRGGASYVDNDLNADHLFNRIQLYSNINRHFRYRYDGELRKHIARYYFKLLASYQYRDTFWPRAWYAFKYLQLKNPSWTEKKDIIRDYLIPPVLMKIYSFLAISFYRLKGKV